MATLLMIEKIEEVVATQVEAIKNLKIDKITVWDSGSGAEGGGSSTANFLSSMVKSLPPLQDVLYKLNARGYADAKVVLVVGFACQDEV